MNKQSRQSVINTPTRGSGAGRSLSAAFIAARAKAPAHHREALPGHGDTAVDSHLQLPTISVDRSRLDALELLPFRKAVEAGVDR